MFSHNAYKRKDGRWEVRIYDNGNDGKKRSYRSFYGKTKEAAELKAQISSKPCVEYVVTEMTVKELSKEYISVKALLLKASTVSNYRMKLETHIIPALGDMECCAIKPQNVYDLMNTMRDKGLSERYISDVVVLLRSIFRYASSAHNIKNNISGIIMPKRTKPEIKILSDREQMRLKTYIDTNPSLTTLGIAISLLTGIRIGELCALQWSNIDLEKRTLTVSKTIQRINVNNGEKRTKLVITEPKSHSSIRTIPIPECLAEMLAVFANSPENYVLSGTAKPVEPRTMQNRFVTILKKAGCSKVTFHSIRHAFASGCIALDFDVKTLSEILGHSSVELTLNRYVHSSFDRKKACMDKLTWVA